MGEFKEVSTRELDFNVFETIEREWGVFTIQDVGKVNGMVISWFQMGHVWQKDLVTVYIRPQRHSFSLVNQEKTFSLCFFGMEEKDRKHLSYLGSASGRDHDKLAECGYHTLYDGETPYIAEAKWVFICEKVYEQDIKEANFMDRELMEKVYPQKDFHRMYMAKIIKVLVKE